MHRDYVILLSYVIQFTEEEFVLRNPEAHDYHCDLLDSSLSAYDSTTYGVNHRSPLNKVDHFHVTSGQLPQDLMHVLFEGVMQLELILLLHKLVCEEQLFTVESLNRRILSFPYGRHGARNKLPKPIEMVHLKGTSKLPLSGKFLLELRKGPLFVRYNHMKYLVLSLFALSLLGL